MDYQLNLNVVCELPPVLFSHLRLLISLFPYMLCPTMDAVSWLDRQLTDPPKAFVTTVFVFHLKHHVSPAAEGATHC